MFPPLQHCLLAVASAAAGGCPAPTMALAGRKWQHGGMRRPSVADELQRAERARIAELSAGERILLALQLGERSLDLFCARSGLSRARARLLLQQRVQSRRRPSSCIEALLS